MAPKKMVTLLRVLLLLSFMLARTYSKSAVKPITTYFTPCPRGNQAHLAECVEKNLHSMKLHMKDGIPNIGIIPIDPLFLPKIAFDEKGSIPLKTTLTNLTLTGIGNGRFMRTTASLTENEFVLNTVMVTPRLRIEAQYDISGQLLLIPLRGNGHMEDDCVDMEIHLRTVSKVVERSGRKHLEVSNVECKIELLGNCHVWFYNLFNGDQVLGNATNTLLNENQVEMHQATRHMPESVVVEVLKNTMNNVFSSYSIDQMFTK